MSKILHHSFYMVVLLVFAASCIHDDYSDCPVQYIVQVSVKDKNYNNIDEYPQLSKIDENLSFRNYSTTIYYTLYNVTTGVLQQESTVTQVSGDDMLYSLSFDKVPNGEYILTVWGNLTSDYPAGTLHPSGIEHKDIYMASRRLNFTSSPQATEMALERTKGQLTIFCTNFPSDITQVAMNITPLYQFVDADFNYSGNVQMSKTTALQPIVKAFAAPSVAGTIAKLNLNFYKANNSQPYLTLPEIDFAVRRNMVSGVKVDYNQQEGTWEIWTNIDGVWTMIHRLDIE